MKPSTAPEERSRTLLVSEVAALLVPAFVIILLGVYPQPLLELLGNILP
jgi:NADH:ubiquinone oxidoreductase subunit 4 (subunit M)